MLHVKSDTLAKDQSLSGLLTSYIEDLVLKKEQCGKTQRQQLKLMEAGIDFDLKGAVNWSREDTYDRQRRSIYRRSGYQEPL